MPIDYVKLLADFQAHLRLRHLKVSQAAAADALACFLSSQFLLFAGPSGTGKSSLARALATFFTDRWAVADAEPGLVRPQDFVGYASSLTGEAEFVPSIGTSPLLALNGDTGHIPVLVVEEINLSPIEGYLGPLTHGLSPLRSERLTWQTHSQEAPVPVRGNANLEVPAALDLAPFPRLLGTLNVDASAPAPANKVSARAAVLLLEPPMLKDVVNLDFPASGSGQGSEPPGYGVAGDPTDALLARISENSDAAPRAELQQAATDALVEERRMSPRMAQRALMYQAAYEEICREASGALGSERARHAAENALLHILLPVLSPSQFTQVAARLVTAADPAGLLAERLSSLTLSEEDWRQAPDDFWSGLS